jgi:DNA-binding transcriptional MerR regulator
VRYYVRERLIDPPTGRGRGAHFDDGHLNQLRRVRLLQDAGLNHAAIRRYGSEIDAILAKRGISRRSWERSLTAPSEEIVRAWHARLAAKEFVPATATVTRVTVAPGMELLVDGSRRMPSPTRLKEAVAHLRAAFGVTDDNADEPDAET